MKKLLFVFTISPALIFQLHAQNPAFSSGLTHYSNVQVFRLKASTPMSGGEWRNVIYLYPEFREGRITLREGFSPTHTMRLNYNIHQSRVEFITEKGDTSTFENSIQLKTMTIGGQIFYNDYPSGYVEKIHATPVALGAKHLLKMMFESTNGELFAGTDWNLRTARLDRLYVKQDEYYFIDKNEVLHKATLPSILKIYHTEKPEIKTYIKKNKIDFKVKEDLIQLLDFCKQF